MSSMCTVPPLGRRRVRALTNLLAEVRYFFVDAGRRGSRAAFHFQKRLGDGDN